MKSDGICTILRFHSYRRSHDAIELIPAQDLVGRDVKGMADGLFVPQQSDKPFGKIAVVRDHPER